MDGRARSEEECAGFEPAPCSIGATPRGNAFPPHSSGSPTTLSEPAPLGRRRAGPAHTLGASSSGAGMWEASRARRRPRASSRRRFSPAGRPLSSAGSGNPARAFRAGEDLVDRPRGTHLRAEDLAGAGHPPPRRGARRVHSTAEDAAEEPSRHCFRCCFSTAGSRPALICCCA
jgi:hypothetical protein